MQQRILDLFKLDGHVALVVGGNRGLGLSMAKALAESGASISIAARDQETNEKASQQLRAEYKVDSISNFCDVTNEQSIHQAVENTISHFGKIDILINSAGINIRGAIENLSVSDFNQVQQVNV